jgi:PAS domain S-box-containing protein
VPEHEVRRLVPRESPVTSPEGPLSPADTALLETLVLQAPVAFAFYGTDLRYRRINRMLAEINGLPMADHVGQLPSELLGDLGAKIEERLREVLDTGQVVVDEHFSAQSPVTGQRRYYSSQWFPARNPGGEVLGVAVLVSDITERRRADAALRRSAERTEALQRATAALGEALTVDDVRRVVAEAARTAAGAREATVVLEGERPPPASARTRVSVDLSVARGGLGRLVLEFDEPVDEDEDAFLGALGGQCSIALERARLYERERETAVTLQRSLLPDRLPEVPGLEIAASFRAGSVDADVGGDWYDVFALPDGRLVLVVGDVMGKGVPAAAGMGRLRSALRALAHANPLPEAVLTGLDRVFTATEDADQIATLVYLLINPVARRAAVGGAGHLPLVLHRAGREPELIDAGSGSTPLGWAEPRVQRTLELGPGDLLLGMTDGLVERRGRDLDVGLNEVLRLVGQGGGSLEDLVAAVGSELLTDTRGRDDATILAVRFAT